MLQSRTYLPAYSGKVEPGMVFRHRRFDISCRVVEPAGLGFIIENIDCEGGTSSEQTLILESDLRLNWQVTFVSV